LGSSKKWEPRTNNPKIRNKFGTPKRGKETFGALRNKNKEVKVKIQPKCGKHPRDPELPLK